MCVCVHATAAASGSEAKLNAIVLFVFGYETIKVKKNEIDFCRIGKGATIHCCLRLRLLYTLYVLCAVLRSHTNVCVCMCERLLIIAAQAKRVYQNECTTLWSQYCDSLVALCVCSHVMVSLPFVYVCASACIRCFRFFGRSWLDTGRSKRTVYIKPLSDWVIFYKHCAARICLCLRFPYLHRFGFGSASRFYFFRLFYMNYILKNSSIFVIVIVSVNSLFVNN